MSPLAFWAAGVAAAQAASACLRLRPSADLQSFPAFCSGVILLLVPFVLSISRSAKLFFSFFFLVGEGVFAGRT